MIRIEDSPGIQITLVTVNR